MAQTSRRVVVIDGEPIVRSVVTSILETAGYSVRATDDVNIVLEVCKDDPPDLVLTNVLLPGITGHDAMRLLKTHCPDVPVLMVSGLPAQPVILDWINQDGFDIFPKPFTAKMLVLKVEEMIARVKRPPDTASFRPEPPKTAGPMATD